VSSQRGRRRRRRHLPCGGAAEHTPLRAGQACPLRSLPRLPRPPGYLVLHDVLDPSLMYMAREAVWDEIQQGIDRNDPETWVGPGSSGFRSGVDANDKPWLLDMLPANPTVSGIAEQLLGKDQVVPLGSAIRGINVNLPFGSDRTEQGIRIESVHKRPS